MKKDTLFSTLLTPIVPLLIDEESLEGQDGPGPVNKERFGSLLGILRPQCAALVAKSGSLT